MTDAGDQNNSAAIAVAWWRHLVPPSEESSRRATRGAQRAALARIRRAATPLEVMQEPEALRLIVRLSGENPDRVAVLAGILAFVREPDKQSIARAIGRGGLDDDQSALMSEGRFRRLLQTDGDGLMDAMRRLVRLTKGSANVYDLSFAVLRWGDKVKRRWIFDYYGVSGIAQPREGAPGSSPASSAT